MKNQIGARYLARKNRQEQTYIAEIPGTESELIRLGNGVVKRKVSHVRQSSK